MKYKWINYKNNKKLIIFFNGWGMDEGIVQHLKPENYDILMFYDYNNLENCFNLNLFNLYEEKNLIAWSMGVMIGSICFKNISFNKTVAINGTLKPIDIEFGIHPKIYDLTIKNFDENGRNKFITSMFSKKEEIFFLRDIENQRNELIALKNYSANEEFKYNKIIISNNDKIIPTKSQVKYWGIEPNLNTGHCPFFEFTKWSDLL